MAKQDRSGGPDDNKYGGKTFDKLSNRQRRDIIVKGTPPDKGGKK